MSRRNETFYIFWHTGNNEPTILCEDGSFYFYNEDSVAIERNEGGRNWTRLESIRDFTPINNWDNFEFMHPETGEWISFGACPIPIVQKIWKLAGAVDWKDIY